MLDQKQLTDLAFRLQEAYGEARNQQTLDPQTLEELSRRVHQIWTGLAPEKEFVAAVNWLAHVVAIHRLDQTPQPKYSGGNHLRIPDVLAVVQYRGHLLPILIEVKSSKENTLIWTADYLRSLQRYARAIKMPLLIAWKYHHIWALTDTRHFKKRKTAYHLDFNTAMKETLMGSLFGDSFVHVTERLKLFIDAHVAEPLPPGSEINIPAGGYTMTITAAGFRFDDQIIKLEPQLFWAFSAAPSTTEVKRIGPQEVRIEFVPEASSIFSLTHLWQQIALLGHDKSNPDWDKIMREPVKIKADALRHQLSNHVPRIASVFHVSPQTMPHFLVKLPKSA